METMTKACPDCGRLVEHSCHHRGQDVSSVLMDALAARRLRKDSYEDAIIAAEGLLVEGDDPTPFDGRYLDLIKKADEFLRAYADGSVGWISDSHKALAEALGAYSCVTPEWYELP